MKELFALDTRDASSSLGRVPGLDLSTNFEKPYLYENGKPQNVNPMLKFGVSQFEDGWVNCCVDGDCESAQPSRPMLISEENQTPVMNNMLQWDSALDVPPYEGTHHYKYQISAAGSGRVSFNDNLTTTDIHERVNGENYRLKMRIYVPTGGGISHSQIYIIIQDYAAGWQNTHIYLNTISTTYDEWIEIEVERTLRHAATGCDFSLRNSGGDTSGYFYVDLIEIEHLIKISDNPVPIGTPRAMHGVFDYGENLVNFPEDLSSWTSSGTITKTLLGSTWEGSTWTRLYGGTNASYVYENTGSTGTSWTASVHHCFSLVIRNIDCVKTIVYSHSGVAILDIRIDWVTKIINERIGSVIGIIWHDENTLELFMRTIDVGNTIYEFTIYPDNLSAPGTIEVTRCMAIDSDYPIPYFKRIRPLGVIPYRDIILPNQGTIMFWAATTCDILHHSGWGKFFEWIESVQTGTYWSSNNRFTLAWYAADPKIINEVRDSSGTAHVGSGTDDIAWKPCTWYLLAVTWKNFNSGSADAVTQIYLDGVALTGGCLNTPAQVNINCGKLLIGINGRENENLVPNEQANFWITNLVVLDYRLSESDILAVYNKDKPYYVKDAVIFDAGSKIDIHGVSSFNQITEKP